MITISLLTTEPEVSVRNAERTCVGKMPLTKIKPWDADEWYLRIKENHSTLRSVRFRIILDNCRSDVARQLARHTTGLTQPYMQSSRPDWTGKDRPPEPYPVRFILDTDPEGWRSVVLKRTCNRAMKETHEQVLEIIAAMRDHGHPFFTALSEFYEPPCENQKHCTERHGCGKYRTTSEILREYNAKVKGDPGCSAASGEFKYREGKE